MTLIPADSYSGALDLLLADGSIIYCNCFGRWFRVVDGIEHYLGCSGGSGEKPHLNGGFDYDTHAANFGGK
tara:strand:- start:342 stop:554 length:213 start_codon:yes stop_codon:yes gene_type:complete